MLDVNMMIANNIQNGKSGTLPTRYQSPKQDIESICVELEQKITDLEREQR